MIAGVLIPEVSSPSPSPSPSCSLSPSPSVSSSLRGPCSGAPRLPCALPGEPRAPASRPRPRAPAPRSGGRTPRPGPAPCRAPPHALAVPWPRLGCAPLAVHPTTPVPAPVPRRPRAPRACTARVPSARAACFRACDRSRAVFNSRLNPF
jgi:hypothetical protein